MYFNWTGNDSSFGMYSLTLDKNLPWWTRNQFWLPHHPVLSYLGEGWRRESVWFSLKNSLFSSSFRTIPDEGGWSQTSISSSGFDCSTCDWEYKYFIFNITFFMNVNTSFALSLRAWSSDASICSNSSRFHPHTIHSRGIYLARLLDQTDALQTGLSQK